MPLRFRARGEAYRIPLHFCHARNGVLECRPFDDVDVLVLDVVAHAEHRDQRVIKVELQTVECEDRRGPSPRRRIDPRQNPPVTRFRGEMAAHVLESYELGDVGPEVNEEGSDAEWPRLGAEEG